MNQKDLLRSNHFSSMASAECLLRVYGTITNQRDVERDALLVERVRSALQRHVWAQDGAGVSLLLALVSLLHNGNAGNVCGILHDVMVALGGVDGVGEDPAAVPITTLHWSWGPVQRRHTAAGDAFFVVDTPKGAVQFGVPTESIKSFDGEAFPKIFVLPQQRGHLSVKDVEFPLFHSFFIQAAFQDPSKRLIIVGTAALLEQVRIIFKVRPIFHPPQLLLLR